MLTTLLLAATLAAADEPPAGYLPPEELARAVESLASAHAGACTIETIGRTAGDRPIVALRLGATDRAGPALLIVAGLDGSHLVGPETAWRVAGRLLERHADLLAEHVVWVVPAVNVDAIARTFEARGGIAAERTSRPIDDDRDGALDEDGPEDIDGDGVVRLMRVADPAPPDAASLVSDVEEPRLLRAPDPVKGERARWRLLTEGLDNDGDGLVNEDDLGGVDLDRNFMHRWPEFESGAGPYPLSEPESLALAQFVLAHPEIACVLVLGRHDNLVRAPESRATDVNPEVPQGIDAADAPLHAELARIYKETVGQTRAAPADAAGSFVSWMYAQRGVPALASTVWGRPDPSPEPAPTPSPDAAPAASPDAGADAAPAAGPEAGPEAGGATGAAGSGTPEAAPPAPAGPPRRRGRGGAPGAAPARAADAAPAGDVAEDRLWLQVSDRDRGGAGFAPWTPFDHPTLGRVEIGGFAPLFRLNPPAAELDALADRQAAFAAEVIRRLPRWTIVGPTSERLAEGLHRVRLVVRNDGGLPTHTAYARRAGMGQPLVIRLRGPVESGEAGRRVERVRGLEAGGERRLEWLVRGADGDALEIAVREPGGAERILTVTLGATKETEQ